MSALARRLISKRSTKLVLFGLGSSSLYFGYKNDFDVSSIGAMRLARAGSTAIRIFMDYKVTFSRLDENQIEETKASVSAAHKRSADRLLALACSNGGVWIKVGQHLGALDYLLPPEYTSTLSILHSKAPESSFEDVCKVIEVELGKDVNELFTKIERTPLGTASLAQAYKAELSDGRVVAVKVQHPRVKAHSYVDIATMEALVRIAAKLFPEFKLLWLVGETKKNLPQELDFRQEGQNADRVRRMFQHLDFLKVPQIVWDLSTDRVLTMEFCDGCQVNDLNYMIEHGIDPDEVSKKIGQLYSEMIFVQGYVHCDPHPGNVMISQDPRKGAVISLLDHGLYTTLNEDFRVNYSKLWLSILGRDLEGIQKYSRAMGVGDLYGLFACMLTARSWKAVTGGIYREKPTEQEDEEVRKYVASLIAHISDVLDRVPRPMILIFKTNDLLRSMEYHLKTERTRSSFVEMTRCCVTALRQFELRQCDSIRCRIWIQLWTWYQLGRLFLFDRYLRWKHFFGTSHSIA